MKRKILASSFFAIFLLFLTSSLAMASYHAATYTTPNQLFTGVNFGANTPYLSTGIDYYNFVDLEEWVVFTPDAKRWIEFGMTDGFNFYEGKRQNGLFIAQRDASSNYWETSIASMPSGYNNYKIASMGNGGWYYALNDVALGSFNESYTASYYVQVGMEDNTGHGIFTDGCVSTDHKLRDVYGGWYNFWSMNSYVDDPNLLDLSYPYNTPATAQYWEKN